MFKVWIVEDDATIAALMQAHLEKEGYTVSRAEQFSDVMPEFAAFMPDIVLMDVILPSFDGYYWCGRIRTVSNVPVLFISSKDSEMDVIVSSNMGGDDYLVKPFTLALLSAKVSGLLRRTYSYGALPGAVVSHKGLLFHTDSGSVSADGGTAELTKNEAQILSLLLAARGTHVSRERLMRALWKESSFVDDNTLTVNITRIRKKLAGIGLADYIETHKGEGYSV